MASNLPFDVLYRIFQLGNEYVPVEADSPPAADDADDADITMPPPPEAQEGSVDEPVSMEKC